MKTVIGIDNGTQSTKVVFYDFEQKKIVAQASAPHELTSRDDGTREQSADWWITALKKCMDQIAPELKKTAIAVGVSGQQHGFVPVDEQGNVLAPVKLWCDTATVKQCKALTAKFGGEKKLLDEVGNLILPGYTLPKVFWLKENKPELYKKMHKILLPHDYLNFYLTGKMVMEYGDASGTALLDIRNRKWSDTLLAVIDPEGKIKKTLPELIKASDFAGMVNAKAAAEFGIPEGIPVSSGGGDNMMGAVGTGTVAEGVITMSLGTSGTIYGYSSKPIIDPDGNLAAFCSSTGGWLPLLCTMNCTVSTTLVQKMYGLSVKEIDEMAAQTPAGSNGMINLPFYNGERTPNLPNGKGCFLGMDMNNVTKGNFIRSSMEAAIFGMKGGIESFQKLGFQAKEIRLIGGGANSAPWRQIAADILELPVVVPQLQEAAALGGALQALWALQINNGNNVNIREITDQHVALKEGTAAEPGADSKKYRDVYNTYQSYLNELTELFQ
ncbi:MAG: xylulokinase [Spirochaetales bacterium]|nr:xylulokinase [Spirochaetales bacterium]